jgi:hypothetical protein
MNHDHLIEKPPDGPLSSRALGELSLYSTFIFVFAALLMQFLLTQYTALLLNAYSVSFQHSLFAINFFLTSTLGHPKIFARRLRQKALL